MIKTPEQFAAANKAATDTLLAIASTCLANTERLAALNLNTARAMFADSAINAGSLMSIKDAQGLFALQSALAKPAIANAIAYSRNLYEIINDSGNGLTQIVESQTAELKKHFSAAVEQSLASAPAGSEPVVAAVKSALAQAASAQETMSLSIKQAKTTIESTLAAANTATIKLIASVA